MADADEVLRIIKGLSPAMRKALTDRTPHYLKPEFGRVLQQIRQNARATRPHPVLDRGSPDQLQAVNALLRRALALLEG